MGMNTFQFQLLGRESSLLLGILEPREDSFPPPAVSEFGLLANIQEIKHVLPSTT
jgi:hypothetical protein